MRGPLALSADRLSSGPERHHDCDACERDGETDDAAATAHPLEPKQERKQQRQGRSERDHERRDAGGRVALRPR